MLYIALEGDVANYWTGGVVHCGGINSPFVAAVAKLQGSPFMRNWEYDDKGSEHGTATRSVPM